MHLTQLWYNLTQLIDTEPKRVLAGDVNSIEKASDQQGGVPSIITGAEAAEWYDLLNYS